MSQLIFENIKLKRQISQYQETNGLKNYLDDSTLRGGYRIVNSIQERNAIDRCHRKIGMVVSVRTSETEYTNYRLIKNNVWVEVTTDGTIPGLSAYQVALLEGFEGTEQDWLDSLVSTTPGPKGDKGDAGVQGPQGEKGEPGYTPQKGIDYFDGAQGDVGPQGVQGEQGVKGDKGDTGEQGPQGPQGVKGDTGTKGDKGEQGEKGDKGDTGEQGIQGLKGDTGDTGNISVINFSIDNNMHLTLQIISDPLLVFELRGDGHLILI